MQISDPNSPHLFFNTIKIVTRSANHRGRKQIVTNTMMLTVNLIVAVICDRKGHE